MVHKSDACEQLQAAQIIGLRGKVSFVIRRLPAMLVFMLTVTACQPPPAVVNRAVTNIDFAWKVENDEILKKHGSRYFKTSRYNAFVAAQGTLRRLGTVVEKQDLSTGFLFATSAAPVPLSPAEWEIVKETDTTDMRKIAVKEVGYMGWFANLDPASKDVLMNVYVEERSNGVDVSIAMRLRNKKDIKGLKKRTQPPPTALKIGLDKFWNLFDEELRKNVVAAPERAVKNIRAPTAKRAIPPAPRTRATSAPKSSFAGSTKLSKQMCITFADASRSIDEVKKALVVCTD